MIFTRKIGKITRYALFKGIRENEFLIYPDFYPGNRIFHVLSGIFYVTDIIFLLLWAYVMDWEFLHFR